VATKQMRTEAPGKTLFAQLMFSELVNFSFLMYLTTF